MPFQFQLNKTSMQKIKKDLDVRRTALPTLKAKETALRAEILKIKTSLEEWEKELQKTMDSQMNQGLVWNEYPGLLSIKSINERIKNIAGVKIPVLVEIHFATVDYSLIANRTWVPGAIEILKDVVNLRLRIQFIKKELDILNHARKKTTQKVNLYEKVQIPEYESAIQKIKRFLEDAENLSRSSQKLIKIRRESELTL